MTLGKNSWDSGKLKGSNVATEWMSLGRFGPSDLILGILRNGDWVANSADGLLILDNPKKMIAVLPLLEIHPLVLKSDLTKRLASLNIDNELLSEFPFNEIVVCGIEGSPYWVDKSILWIEVLGVSSVYRQEVIDRLTLISIDNLLSQKTRHKIQRILKNEQE